VAGGIGDFPPRNIWKNKQGFWRIWAAVDKPKSD